MKRYWSMGGNTLAEDDGSGNLTAEYIYFDSARVARIDLPSTVHYYLSDHLNSTSMVVSATGAIEQESDYSSFGTEYVVSGADSNHYKFTGKERDNETGLDYFGARYYSNGLGRFVTPDPLMASAHVADPQSWNRYTYARNNPLRFIDPTGMSACQNKDESCIHVNVNVVYDKNANDGKGLTDKQKQEFEKNQLAEAQKQYGTADISLDVKYTAGQINTDSNGFVTGITGLQKDAINVVVTGTIPVSLTTSDGVSFMTKSGTAVSIVEAGAGKETTAHELAHHFLGDTKSSGFAGMIQNVFADINNDMARTSLGSFGRWQNSVFGTQTFDRGTGGLVSKYENFRSGAQSFSVSTDPAANRPQTK